MNNKLKNTAFSFAMKAFGILLGFAATAILTNSLGADAFGVYSVVVSFTMLASILSRYGLDLQVIRDSRIGSWTPKSVGMSALKITLISAIIFSVVFFMVINLASKRYQEFNYVFILINTIGLSGVLILTSFYRGLMYPILAQFFESIFRQLVFVTLLMIVLYYQFKSAEVMYAVQGLSYLVTMLLMFFLVPKLCSRIGSSSKSEDGYSALDAVKSSSGINFFVISVAGYIWRRSDLLIMGVLLPVSSAGHYSLALRLSEIMAMLVTISNQVIAPYVAKAFRSGTLAFEFSDIKKISQYIFVSYAFVFVVFSLFSVEILSIFGKDFEQAKLIVLTILAIQSVNVFFGPAGMILNMTGYEGYCRKVLVWVAVLAIPLNLMLIPLFGVFGGAITTLFCISFNNYLYYRKVREVFDYSTIVIKK
jgi:O-antigen/teichoic acid export membrane protein